MSTHQPHQPHQPHNLNLIQHNPKVVNLTPLNLLHALNVLLIKDINALAPLMEEFAAWQFVVIPIRLQMKNVIMVKSKDAKIVKYKVVINVPVN